jgi:tetratricopeptide (TPR) repeat protein/predicted Ser/Thr protein kinase
VIGERLSHYRVLERLGQGAMGDVYLAEDERLHRPVALKLLRPELARDGDARGRLLREARAASALTHPNVAVIYEVDEAGQGDAALPFIAMEYVSGPALDELVAQDALDTDEAVRIGVEVAEALADAHAAGIVHRDLKPSNVKLAARRRVKVLDFGLAARSPLGDADDSTWSRDPAARAGLVGTLAYMAPEQALGHAADGRADVFSLGVLLYEMLSGSRPFQGRNGAQVLNAVLHAEPPALQLRRADPRAAQLETLLSRMLRKDAAARPQSMRDVGEALNALLRGEAGAGAPAAAPARPALGLLGFANITGRNEDDWLGTGLLETLSSELRRGAGQALLAQEAMLAARRRLGVSEVPRDDASALRLGREAGAARVLVGGYQVLGERVRVTASLLDVASGALLHACKLDGERERIFEVQDRLARELLAQLQPAGQEPPRAHYETRLVSAYEAYSKGLLNSDLETHESLSRAILLFERAVALDPGYALAWLELGVVYFAQAGYLGADELYERALGAYRRAHELRPELPRAWREMGSALVGLGRTDEGIAAIRHALELDPRDGTTLAAMARALFIGKGDLPGAASWFERALQEKPQAGWYALQLSHCRALLGQLEQAEAMARRTIALQEAFLSGQHGVLIIGAYMRLGHALALRGRHAEAAAQFLHELSFLNKVDHALRSRITIELHLRLGAAQQALGRAAEGKAALDVARSSFEERVRLGADDPFTRYYAGCAYALLGDPDQALHSLALAAQARRSFVVVRAQADPFLASLRGDPRFERLLRETDASI